jgi:hypothetical protein
MTANIEFTVRKNSPSQTSSNYAGGSTYRDNIIARGTCSFCGDRAAFRQIGTQQKSRELGRSVAVRCDGCHSILSLAIDGEKLYPAPKIQGIDGLPDSIDEYYQEALRCIASDSPNGAVTLFRKVIHAIAIHYDISDIDDNLGIYKMIKKLDEDGHINSKLRKSLLATKDIGNDGAHINENEPDIEQTIAIKGLVDAVLNSTVIADQNIEFAREKHPNPHVEES